MFAIRSNQLVGWILSFFILAVRAQSNCNHDACYNALFPCNFPLAISQAVNYCSTVGHYGATDFPAQATAACGNTNRRAYLSACACGPACSTSIPNLTFSTSTVSVPITLTSSTISTSEISVPITLTSSTISTSEVSIPITVTGSTVSTSQVSIQITPTLTTTSGGSAQSTSGSSASASNASTSVPLTSNSTASSIGDPGSSSPPTFSSFTANVTSTSSTIGDSGLTSSISGTTTGLNISTSATTSVTAFNITTSSTATITFSASGNLSSTSSNAFSTFTPTGSWLSGGSSSIPLSTFVSNGFSQVSSSIWSAPSSSALWTNSTCTSWVTLTTSTSILGTGSSALTALSASTTSGNLTTSFGSSSSTSSPFPNSTFTGVTTGSGSLSTDTCIETPTPTPTPIPTEDPCDSSGSYQYGNSTASGVVSIPSGEDPSTSTLSASSLPSLSSTSDAAISASPSPTSLPAPWSGVPFPTLQPSASPASSQATPTASCVRTASNGAVQNGDFENGLSPWSIDLVDIMSTSYEVSTPGADGSCGAFHVSMARNLQTDDLRSNLRLVSPLIVLPPPEANWTVSFWTRFGAAHKGSFLELLANEAVAHRVNATAETADWTRVEFPYSAESGTRMLQFVFSFVLGEGAESNEIWVDKVTIDVPPTTS